eukprot:gene472-695_t
MYDTEGLLSVITLNAIASVVLVLIARVVQNETKRGRVMAWKHWYAFCEKEEIKGSSILDDKKLEIRPTLCGSKVNAIKHHRTVVDECYEELLAMKAEVEELESDALGLAYVTFNTSIDCCRYIIHANEKSLIGGQKTDHAAMAARSFYCPPSDDPPAPTQRICASESVFFSNPTTPTKSADDHFGTFA